MKVICTSQQENVAQSLSIHKTSLVTTGKFTAASMRKNSCRQSFVGKTAKEAIYSYGHRNPQGLAKHPTTELFGIKSTDRKAETKSTS
jgi:glucose/arabinose dehydrogenase